MDGEPKDDPIQAVVPLLVEVRDNLDGDLTLGALARRAGSSPFHFHRQFSSAVGETPGRYIARLRLERAAYLLAVTEASVLDIGLDVGFRSHETFSRAFRRAFGHTPSAYRKLAKAAQRARMHAKNGFRGDGCRLSEVRFEVVPETPLLAIRRFGAYAQFDPDTRASLWDELEAWAVERGIACGPQRLGFFPDDPGMTPGPLQTADLCIPIGSAVAGTERFRSIVLTGGLYGVIDHEGPYETISQAYQTVADGIRRSERYGFREGAPMQLFIKIHEGGDPAANHSRVCFPVRKTA